MRNPQGEHRSPVFAASAGANPPQELEATLHAALRILREQEADLLEEARVRSYACDGESPIEEVAVRAVNDLLEALLTRPDARHHVM